jgi:hypothetical protein
MSHHIDDPGHPHNHGGDSHDHHHPHNHGGDSHDHHHPHSHAHGHDGETHDHGHGGHDHGHTHHPSPAAAGELTFEQKLRTLFTHWVDHNESHLDNYRAWALKAEQANLTETAACLREAADASATVTAVLSRALKSLAG